MDESYIYQNWLDFAEMEGMAERAIMEPKKMIFRSLLGLVAAAMLSTPTVSSAITLTISVGGFNAVGLGGCTPSGSSLYGLPPPTGNPADPGDPLYHPICTDANDPNIAPSAPYDGTGDPTQPADQFVFVPIVSFAFSSTGGPFTLDQTWFFYPGDTGAPTFVGGVGIDEPFTVSRSVTLTDGVNTDVGTLTAHGDLQVGELADTLTIGDCVGLPLTVSGLSVTVGCTGFARTAGVDPEGDSRVLLDVNQSVPLPSTLALLGLGLAGIRLHRRQ